MTKCLINSDNEITGFWDDDKTAPENALECDKSYPIHGGGEAANQTFFYKLENGKVITTDAGKVYTAQEYARNRALEYPPIADQQDMQFHDAIDGTTTWQDAIQAVKNKYPKSE